MKAILSKHTDRLTLFVLFLFFLILSRFIVNSGDDFTYQAALEKYGSLGAWLSFYAENWSGRLIPNILLVLLLQMPDFVFDLVNAFFWVVLIDYAVRDFGLYRAGHRNLVLFLMPAFIFTLIPWVVTSASCFWKSANVTYLWGTASMLAALYPSICLWQGRSYETRDLVIAFFAAVYAAGCEQAGAFLVCALGVMWLAQSVRDRRLNKQLLILFLLSLTLFGVFLLMPGNQKRAQEEVLAWNQSFDMYSVLDKLLIGVRYALFYTEQQLPVFFVLLSCMAFWAVRHYRTDSRFFRLTSAAVLCYFVLYFACVVGAQNTEQSTMLSHMGTLLDVTEVSFDMPTLLLKGVIEAVNILMLVLLGALLTVMIPGSCDLFAFLTFFGSFAMMVVMGFSACVETSGARVRFPSYYLLLCLVLHTFTELCAQQKTDDPGIRMATDDNAARH